MGRWWAAALLLLVVWSGTVVPNASAQNVTSVELRMEATPIGQLITPVAENGTARVTVEVVCRTPAALLPGWSIQHSIRVEPPVATATLDITSQTVAMEPMQCTDGTPSTYVVLIDVVFHEVAAFNNPVRFVLEAQPTLEHNPSYSVDWEDRPGFIGGFEVETNYPARVRTGSLNELGFWVTNKANAPLIIGANVTTAPLLGEASFTDERSLSKGDRRIFRLHYTPEAEGEDQIGLAVHAVAPGGIALANKTLLFAVISDPEAEPARVKPQYSGEAPAPVPIGLAALLAVLMILRRRDSA